MCKGQKHTWLVDNNRRQIEEALGDDNRYFAGLFYGRAATEEELVIYYIEHGGAEGHRRRIEMRDSETEIVHHEEP